MNWVKNKATKLLLCGVLLNATQTLAEPSTQSSLSADEIMYQVDKMTRKSYATRIATVKINTCKYTMVNGNVRCADKPRVVIVENAAKVKGDDNNYGKDTLLFVSEPLGDKGSTLLVYEYEERGRDNDNWLYLPALGKVNRVIATDDEGGSVFGSEFSVETTENPEARKVYEYTYKLTGESTFQGRQVWTIEIKPTPEKAKKTRYEKVNAWIDKETFLPLKEDLYRNGKLYKQRTQSNIKKIDGVYAITTTVMNNLSSSRISQMDHLSMRYNVDIPNDYFNQRALTDFVYRERQLAKFRSWLNQEKLNAQ